MSEKQKPSEDDIDLVPLPEMQQGELMMGHHANGWQADGPKESYKDQYGPGELD